MTQIFCGPIKTYHFHLNLRFYNGYVLTCAHTPQDALSKKKNVIVKKSKRHWKALFNLLVSGVKETLKQNQ